uniref:Retrotransposon gag domain-containing protein n=1 Tax=Bracon brevicornis TaxID=1563983 RepID=A0A6V7JH24_9HYME
MNASKLKFVSTAKQRDGKGYIAITSIITEENKFFLISEELETSTAHREIYETAAYANIRNTIKKLHQTRSVWIPLTEDIKKEYFDEDGNAIFTGYYLEEAENPPQSETRQDNTMTRILEKLVENQEKNRKQNVRKTAERFRLEKFDGKNKNAQQWMELFESECEKFEISEDEDKIETLRIFLDKSCTDWYSTMLMKQTLQLEWGIWKEQFCKKYTTRGWTSTKYALSHAYKSGSLLEYAIKKEKLLLQDMQKMDNTTLINLIAHGSPEFILGKIDKEKISQTTDLYNEIGKLEHLAMKTKQGNKKIPDKPNTDKKQKCNICERLNKGTRYHPEESCGFKDKDSKNNNQVKLINNAELEVELQNENELQKNL